MSADGLSRADTIFWAWISGSYASFAFGYLLEGYGGRAIAYALVAGILLAVAIVRARKLS